MAPSPPPQRPLVLVIQIPCHNEAASLPRVLGSLPRQLEGFARVQALVVDDGSQDATAEIAEAGGARVLRLGARRGLASAFASGLEEALRMGADVVVNTDGDDQYPAAEIPRLLEPLRGRRCAMALGCRDIAGHPEFSLVKKLLQGLGSAVVGWLSGVRVPDATTGFRALTREAALRLLVISRYTYTLETLIQAGHEGIEIVWVPVRVNPSRRPSRLMRSIGGYVANSAATILRTYATYAPLRAFFTIGAVFLAAGALGVARFLYYYLSQPAYSGHIQSLVVSVGLLVLGVQTLFIGMLADLVAVNRKILQDVLIRLKREDTRPTAEEPRR